MTIPSASLLENARFNALVIVPNAVQGIFRRRRTAVAAATRLNVDGHARGLLAGMARSYGGGPVWVRVVRDPALLLLSPTDAHRALAGSPAPFASDPEPKRKGMCVFQPDALTISRGELWRARRGFTEAVLDTGRPLHRLAERFAAAAAEEAVALATEAQAGGPATLAWEAWHRCFRRLTRRVVLGDAARDDEELSAQLAELMSEANGMPGEPSEGYPELEARIGAYVEAADPQSLVGLFAEAPAGPETNPAGQVPHWLFAMQDTLAINAFRALALIASHPRQRAIMIEELTGAATADGLGAESVARLVYLEGCLEEAMRLWPTTPMLSRETLAETDWRGTAVPAGTQVLISNTLFHRDRDRHAYADRFAPERWVEGDAAEDWSFNHFSGGPQGCPGAGLTLFAGKALLAALLRERGVGLERPAIDPGRALPDMLDFFALRFRLAPASVRA
ncbi:MAG: cytochrome P450 [Solirubrobacterales bacterium]